MSNSMDNYFFILDGTTPQCVDADTFARWYSTANRTVRKTSMADVEVSTVFLGMNHSYGDGPPVLFETMVFGGPHDGEAERYGTWEDALAGHENMCGQVFETDEILDEEYLYEPRD